MNSQKIITSFLMLSILVLAIGSVSALTITNPSQITRNNNQVSVTLSNNENLTDVNLAFNPNPLAQGTSTVTFSASETGFSLTAGTPKTINILSIFSTESFDLGEYTSAINVTGKNSTGDLVSVSNSIKHLSTFCSNGQNGTLEIRNVDFQNDGDGADDVWKLLDDITIEVEVKNTGDVDIRDVFVEIGLIDSDGRDTINDVDFDNSDEERFDIGNVRKGDRETAIFTFKVPADFLDGTYKFVVKAYGDREGEANICDDRATDLDRDYYQSIDVERETDRGRFISFTNIELKPADATCGDTVELTTDAYNIGDEDQDQVRMNLFGSSLNVDLSKEIRSDMNQGDKERLSFTFIVPQDAKNKLHTLSLTSDYNYRKSSDSYRESSDDETKTTLNVIGCSEVPKKTSSISAKLDSEAKAGIPLVVKSTIKNLKDSSASFVIEPVGYESWATLDSISSRLITLNVGEEKEIVFTFTPKDDSEGQKSFTIKAQSGSDVETRDVLVTLDSIVKPTGFFSGSSLGSGNTLIWVIGVINVILIILIIFVAVSLSRR